MKFSILNLFFFVAVVGLSAAVIRERIADKGESSRWESVVNGSIHAIHADRAITLAEYYFDSPKQFANTMQDNLVWEVLFLSKHENDVDLAFDFKEKKMSAHRLAKQALRILECENWNQFFELAKTLESFEDNEEIFPELFNPDSKEFKTLKVFVVKAFVEE